MINWIKNKLGITKLELENARLNQSLITHQSFVTNKIAELKEDTRVDADIGFRGNNTIIAKGYDIIPLDIIKYLNLLREWESL